MLLVELTDLNYARSGYSLEIDPRGPGALVVLRSPYGEVLARSIIATEKLLQMLDLEVPAISGSGIRLEENDSRLVVSTPNGTHGFFSRVDLQPLPRAALLH